MSSSVVGVVVLEDAVRIGMCGGVRLKANDVCRCRYYGCVGVLLLFGYLVLRKGMQDLGLKGPFAECRGRPGRLGKLD